MGVAAVSLLNLFVAASPGLALANLVRHLITLWTNPVFRLLTTCDTNLSIIDHVRLRPSIYRGNTSLSGLNNLPGMRSQPS